MGKNNRLIEQMKTIARRNRANNVQIASNAIVPQVYAAIAIALHRELGWGHTRINRLFVASQKIWEQFNGKPSDMIELCEKETGMFLIGADDYCCQNCADYRYERCRCKDSDRFGDKVGKYDVCTEFGVLDNG